MIWERELELSEPVPGRDTCQKIGNADGDVVIQAVLIENESGTALASLGQIRSAASGLILQVRHVFNLRRRSKLREVSAQRVVSRRVV